MNQLKKWSLLLGRLSLGWLYLYAGIDKLMNPKWSAAGYLKGAKYLSGFYAWLMSPGLLPIVNFINEWGLLLLGLSLILGVGMKISVKLGVLLMLLYYIAVIPLQWGAQSFITDEHVIYSFTLLLLLAFGADRVWSLRNWLMEMDWVKNGFLGKIV